MAFRDKKPGAGKFASGDKFKGRPAAGGNSGNNRSSRSFDSDRPSRPVSGERPFRGEPGAERPAREDRTAKFKGEGKKIYNRSERFTRPTDETGARSGGERTRSSEDRRSSFKSGTKFNKPAPFKSSRFGEGGERNANQGGGYSRDRPDRPARPDRPERSERRDRPDRDSDDRPERPRYSEGRNENRPANGGYAARGERRPAPGGARKPYAPKPYGEKSFGDRDKRFGDREKRPDNRENRPNDRENRFGDREKRPDERENRFDDREKRPARKYEATPPDTRNRTDNREKPFSREQRGEYNREAGAKRPYDRERPHDDKSSDRRSQRAPRPGALVTPGEAPSYDLKRYQAREERLSEKRDDGLIRLNRYIANAGVCSRREADSLIAAGEIKVNGEPVTEMGYLVKPEDTVTYGKKRLNREKMVYVLLNKPKDFITTTEDPEGRKTVMDLVATASKERIFPVGRLDRNTTGLLLFTNDGELAQKLTHPSNNISKIYQVELDKPLTRDHFEMITNGLELEDGKADVDDLAFIGNTNTFLGIQIHIGKNRIVRRIFEHLGYDVVSLDRVQYASLTKKDVPRGKWRYLSEKEVIRLKYFS